MKSILLSFVFACIANYAFSQNYIILARTDDGRWRYYDIEGKIICDKKYPVYYNFTKDGVGVAGDEDLYHIINAKGEEINTEIPVHIWNDHRYIKAWFSDGLLVTRHRSKFGCLDTQGRIAIPHKYYDIEEFKEGHAIARIKKDFFVLNKRGGEIQINDSTIKNAKPFYENLAAYSTKNGTSGFIDTTGQIVIPAMFESVGNFSDGLAWARGNNDLIGFINREGKWAIEPKFDGVGNFLDGLAWARADNGLVGFINQEGKWVIEPSFDAVKNFDKESGLAKVKSLIKKREPDPVTGANTLVTSWNWVYINKEGVVQKTGLLGADDCDEFSEGLAACKKDKKFGFMNNKGEWVIQPKFSHVREFKDDVACAEENGLWGVIDKQGNWILTPRFEVVKGVVKIE